MSIKCNLQDLPTNEINELTQQLKQGLTQDLTEKLTKEITNKFNNSSLPQAEFNRLIRRARNAIVCDSECQFQKESQSLYQTYINSQTNLESAPSQFQLAQKNYVTFTEGESAYNVLIINELTKKANEIVKKFKKNFEKKSIEIQTFIETYIAIIANYNNVVDLFIKYKEENDELIKKLKLESNDILTNDRKTYYEDQQISVLKNNYFYLFAFIYLIVTICFIIFYFMYPSKLSWIKHLIVFICLIILPFLSYWILSMLIFLAYKLYELFPKNVYANMNSSYSSSASSSSSR